MSQIWRRWAVGRDATAGKINFVEFAVIGQSASAVFKLQAVDMH